MTKNPKIYNNTIFIFVEIDSIYIYIFFKLNKYQ